MQNIIVEKPYRFLAPHRGDGIPTLIQSLRVVDCYLNKFEGIVSHEVRGVEHLRESLRQGHSILLAPNHCRYADPIAMGWVAREANIFLYTMASWHLFQQSRLQSFAIRLCGGFSVYREGVDRQSLATAVELLNEAKRPLVVFAEGTVFRTNDLLQPLLDGVSFLARTAARRRDQQDGGRVVVHPVAIKYLFGGELQTTLSPVLASLEQRLNIHRLGPPEPLLVRIAKLQEAMLTLKEIQYMGSAQAGPRSLRQQRLIEHLLEPLEQRWLGRRLSEPIMPRVKQLRTAIVPQLFQAEPGSVTRDELWAQLADIYIAQQIASHPPDYLQQPTDTRVLETVEALEEDLTDRARLHRPLHAILEVGQAIEVKAGRAPRGEQDPLMVALTASLRSMLSRLAQEAQPLSF
ncbi:MAG: 1-acyl-sn-glycerol-3-phosphate acyltransferase [Planctomycetales bacterium]|nr:1-acyl-sn-glycerol-3-phosphate acyltransferase [Planctomycetales bacterium]